MSKERIEKINKLLGRYYESEDSFEQTDLAIDLIQGHMNWLIKEAEKVGNLQDKLNAKITLVSNGNEEEQYVLQEQNKELKNLCLWSARRLKHQQYKDFAYDQFEKITGEKWKDYDDTI